MWRSASARNRPDRPRAHRRAIPVVLLLGLCLGSSTPAVAGQSQAILFVPDRTAGPGEETFAEAILLRKGILGLISGGIQGETLLFLDPSGSPLARKLTDPSGMARTALRAPSSGLVRIRVELVENPRFKAEPDTGRIFVWNNTRPPFFVCVEGGLLRQPAGPSSILPSWGRGDELPGSRETLNRLCPAFDLAYFTRAPRSEYPSVRRWIKDQGFPDGPVLALGPGPGLPQQTPPSAAHLRLLQSLWKNRRKPAYLVTADRAFAQAAAESGFVTYLLVSEPDGPSETGEEPSSGSGEGNHPVRIRGWEGLDPSHRTPGETKRGTSGEEKGKERKRP
jgi:hypothetical protein